MGRQPTTSLTLYAFFLSTIFSRALPFPLAARQYFPPSSIFPIFLLYLVSEIGSTINLKNRGIIKITKLLDCERKDVSWLFSSLLTIIGYFSYLLRIRLLRSICFKSAWSTRLICKLLSQLSSSFPRPFSPPPPSSIFFPR